MTPQEMLKAASELRRKATSSDESAQLHEELAQNLRHLARGRRLEAQTLEELAKVHRWTQDKLFN